MMIPHLFQKIYLINISLFTLLADAKPPNAPTGPSGDQPEMKFDA